MGIFKSDIDSTEAALALINMIRGTVFNRIMMPEFGIDNDESYNTIRRIFLDGVMV
jgi:hypothetical protein